MLSSSFTVVTVFTPESTPTHWVFLVAEQSRILLTEYLQLWVGDRYFSEGVIMAHPFHLLLFRLESTLMQGIFCCGAIQNRLMYFHLSGHNSDRS